MSRELTQCPQCREEFRVESSLIGKQMTCPFCYRKFIVSVRQKQTVEPEEASPRRPEDTPEGTKSPDALFSWSSRKGLLIVLFLLGGLVLLCDGIFFQDHRTEKGKAGEEAHLKAEEEARVRAEQEQQAQEAARKALEERDAARQEWQQAEAEKGSEEEKRLDEIKRQLSKTWESSRRQNLGNKLFIAVTSPKKSKLLLFRYDSELESLVDEVLSARNRIVRYNRLLREAVFEAGLGDRTAVAKLCQAGLGELEGKSDETEREILELSEKIAGLAVRKRLLVHKFELPEDGYLTSKISPGRYLIVYLPEKEVGCEYVFEKEKKVPLALAAEKNRWHNVSGSYRYIWDPERNCEVEVNRGYGNPIRVVEERNGRWRVKEAP